MCLLFGTIPQKELKIKIEDRVGNLIETPESEGKGKTKCPRRRGSGSVYIRLKIPYLLLRFPNNLLNIHKIGCIFPILCHNNCMSLLELSP